MINADYAELKRLIAQRGLLDKQPGYYVLVTLLTTTVLVLGGVLLVTVHNRWLHVLIGALGAVPLAQVGYLLHDSAHQGAFKRSWHNDALALFAGNLVSGVSRTWWAKEHNTHHGNPNILNEDPAIQFPLLAFHEEQLEGKSALCQFVIKHQAIFFVPLVLVQPFNMRRSGIRSLLANRPPGWRLELVLIAVGFALFYGFVLFTLGLPYALLFILVNQGVMGFYLGMSFAINHKGMPILRSDARSDFLWRQVVTARDVKLSRLGHFLLGGASLQIEHHLFPTMPRSRLPDARPIVKEFCAARGIPYEEAGLLRSYVDVFRHLHRVGASLRHTVANN
jgi:fatty acid desaturase